MRQRQALTSRSLNQEGSLKEVARLKEERTRLLKFIAEKQQQCQILRSMCQPSYSQILQQLDQLQRDKVALKAQLLQKDLQLISVPRPNPLSCQQPLKSQLDERSQCDREMLVDQLTHLKKVMKQEFQFMKDQIIQSLKSGRQELSNLSETMGQRIGQEQGKSEFKQLRANAIEFDLQSLKKKVKVRDNEIIKLKQNINQLSKSKLASQRLSQLEDDLQNHHLFKKQVYQLLDALLAQEDLQVQPTLIESALLDKFKLLHKRVRESEAMVQRLKAQIEQLQRKLEEKQRRVRSMAKQSIAQKRKAQECLRQQLALQRNKLSLSQEKLSLAASELRDLTSKVNAFQVEAGQNLQTIQSLYAQLELAQNSLQKLQDQKRSFRTRLDLSRLEKDQAERALARFKDRSLKSTEEKSKQLASKSKELQSLQSQLRLLRESFRVANPVEMVALQESERPMSPSSSIRTEGKLSLCTLDQMVLDLCSQDQTTSKQLVKAHQQIFQLRKELSAADIQMRCVVKKCEEEVQAVRKKSKEECSHLRKRVKQLSASLRAANEKLQNIKFSKGRGRIRVPLHVNQTFQLSLSFGR